MLKISERVIDCGCRRVCEDTCECKVNEHDELSLFHMRGRSNGIGYAEVASRLRKNTAEAIILPKKWRRLETKITTAPSLVRTVEYSVKGLSWGDLWNAESVGLPELPYQNPTSSAEI